MTLTLVLKKGFYPKEYIIMKYESSTTYDSKAMTNVKVFADKQMDKNRQAKNYVSRYIDAGA